MPPYAYSSSDSDSAGEPEDISLSQGKKNVHKLENERRIAEASRRKARKERNRELDRKLKERSAVNKSSRGKPSETRESIPGESDGVGRAEEDSESEERIEDRDDDDDDDSGSESGDDTGSVNPNEAEPPKPTMRKPHHLPDGLFEAAFSSKASKRQADSEDDSEVPSDVMHPKKRKSKSKSKDLVFGSRTIRIVSDSPMPSVGPSQKSTKFIDRALALRPGKRGPSRWERKPVNIGVLKRHGPAAFFVRKT